MTALERRAFERDRALIERERRNAAQPRDPEASPVFYIPVVVSIIFTIAYWFGGIAP